jgi:hypothetical protein
VDRRLVGVMAVEFRACHVDTAERLVEGLPPIVEGDVVRRVDARSDRPVRLVLDDRRPDQVVLVERTLLGLKLVYSLLQVHTVTVDNTPDRDRLSPRTRLSMRRVTASPGARLLSHVHVDLRWKRVTANESLQCHALPRQKRQQSLQLARLFYGRYWARPSDPSLSRRLPRSRPLGGGFRVLVPCRDFTLQRQDAFVPVCTLSRGWR